MRHALSMNYLIAAPLLFILFPDTRVTTYVFSLKLIAAIASATLILIPSQKLQIDCSFSEPEVIFFVIAARHVRTANLSNVPVRL